MTRTEALKEAERCLTLVANAQLSGTSHGQFGQFLLAKAEAGKAFIELARELDSGYSPL